jgi:hypothetical protein
MPPSERRHSLIVVSNCVKTISSKNSLLLLAALSARSYERNALALILEGIAIAVNQYFQAVILTVLSRSGDLRLNDVVELKIVEASYCPTQHRLPRRTRFRLRPPNKVLRTAISMIDAKSRAILIHLKKYWELDFFPKIPAYG